MHATAACSILLALHLHSGAHISQHASYDDRVAWVLPPDRLEAFRRSGVVINEDRKTTVTGRLIATKTPRGLVGMDGTLFKSSEDVPRHRVARSLQDFHDVLTPRNEQVPARLVDVEDAGMDDYPGRTLCIGQSWSTRLPVMTTLGSGTVSIQHTIVGIHHGLVEIEVRGAGTISGAEYNLPRLLPGSMHLSGTAWFDQASGIIAQESYILHNRLIRTVNGKTIGFLETETVDVTNHTAK